jgi:mRNA degradation ribonuclease J1/J2
LGIDGYQLIDMESQVIYTRKILSTSGTIFISVVPGYKPVICSYGLLPENNYDNFLQSVSKITLENMKNYRVINRKDIVNNIINEVNAEIRQHYGKNPLVSVHILNINTNSTSYNNNHNNYFK